MAKKLISFLYSVIMTDQPNIVLLNRCHVLMLTFSCVTIPDWSWFQLIPLPGTAQAKIEDVSRLFLNHVSQMPMNVPMIQVKLMSHKKFALVVVVKWTQYITSIVIWFCNSFVVFDFLDHLLYFLLCIFLAGLYYVSLFVYICSFY